MIEYIDIYCERTVPGFFSEPLNAITNVAFFIAAFLAYRLARQHKSFDKGSILLLALLVAIGSGSFLFHTMATGWAMLTDVIPILIFQIVFIFVYSRQVVGLPEHICAALLLLFFVFAAGFGALPEHWLNGSLGYAPAFLFLLGLGTYHFVRKKVQPLCLLLAACVFSVSLLLRTIDMGLCEIMPIGTHFIWHCLNAVVLYLSIKALILNRNTQ